MKVAFQKEDLQLLASILQEQLLLELPSGKVFQVKCAVQNDELMILTQHPQDVIVDTETIFGILEEALQWQSQYHAQRVQFYVRVLGEKLPYAKHSIIVQAKDAPPEEETFSQEESDSASAVSWMPAGLLSVHTDGRNGSGYLIFPPPNHSDSPSSEPQDHISETLLSSSVTDNYGSETLLNSSTTDDYLLETLHSSSTSDDYLSNKSFSSDTLFDSDSTFESGTSFLEESDNRLLEEEKFDPFADGENLSNRKKLSRPSLPILLGAVLGVIVIFGGGAFYLTRSCAIGQCQELQTAEKFKSESEQLMGRAKSEQELLGVQQQLDAVISDLKTIPQWSPRYQQAQELTSSFSDQSAKVNQVIKALQAATVAEQKTQTPASSLEELRSRQNLWRQAIAPLESIKSGSPLYGLVQAKLPNYQRNLQTLNQQLLKEEIWLKKLATAKTIAQSATQSEAKSINDLQKVKSAWEGVFSSLKSIPPTSTAYQEAQNLLGEYQPQFTSASDRAKKEARAATTYQQAVNLASQAKVYERKGQWQAAAASWQQAVQTAGQISQDSLNYNQAQTQISSYSTALTEAQTKQQLYGNLTQTRADLNSTCVNGSQFCTYTINNQTIIVRLTPEYDQQLQSGNLDLQNHFQTLREALGVISENANLRLVLYNSQGQERYMKQPQ